MLDNENEIISKGEVSKTYPNGLQEFFKVNAAAAIHIKIFK
jgi:hypothetical protein